jgi:hypothetical protein
MYKKFRQLKLTAIFYHKRLKKQSIYFTIITKSEKTLNKGEHTGSPLRWTGIGICVVILLTTVITATTCRGEPVCSP